uniref:Uncharacterized protein n=1 Tax=Timema cristinae TaxID=61476 RepID=A0A7R9H4C0_TIMCR|nr:unnamed protein product [Timema cristinae]
MVRVGVPSAVIVIRVSFRMSNFVINLVFLLFVPFEYIFCWTTEDIVVQNPNFPGMCYDKYGDVFHEEGANWFDNVNCVKYTCRQDYDDNHMVVVTNGCLQLDAKPPCKIRYGNGRAVYPGCLQEGLVPGHQATHVSALPPQQQPPLLYTARFGARTPGGARIGASSSSSTKTSTTATSYTLLVSILRGLVPGHQAVHVSALPPQQPPAFRSEFTVTPTNPIVAPRRDEIDLQSISTVLRGVSQPSTEYHYQHSSSKIFRPKSWRQGYQVWKKNKATHQD